MSSNLSYEHLYDLVKVLGQRTLLDIRKKALQYQTEESLLIEEKLLGGDLRITWTFNGNQKE